MSISCGSASAGRRHIYQLALHDEMIDDSSVGSHLVCPEDAFLMIVACGLDGLEGTSHYHCTVNTHARFNTADDRMILEVDVAPQGA
jgi:hypothetical protein